MIKTYGMSLGQQDQVWDRWRGGESLSKIAVSVGRSHQHVRRFLMSYGGVRPKPPRRSKRSLSAAEREEISRGLTVGRTYREIGRGLGRSHTTICREVGQNGGRYSYRATRAEMAATLRRRRPKQSKLAVNANLRLKVQEWLKLEWSPEQISHRLEHEFSSDSSMRVSHECIYLAIYQPHRKALKRGMHAHLRSGRTMRNPKRPKASSGRGRLKNMTPISERPDEATSREVIGHIEGDLIMGKRPSAIATLVDRRTRRVQLVALGGIKAEPVRKALAVQLLKLPEKARRTLTWDRGREMAQHQELTRDTSCQVYFCEPQSPWQRGTNENTNRLLRQYLSKNADLSTFTQADLDKIATKLNERPRQTLNWRTPNEAYAEATGATTG